MIDMFDMNDMFDMIGPSMPATPIMQTTAQVPSSGARRIPSGP
jgi:hypothetical protein